jgi:hypothetical protein
MLAGGLVACWVGLLSVDTLCPEHRGWVIAIALTALVSGVSAIAGLVGQRAWAPVFAVTTAVLGIAVGAIDTAHSPNRGIAIALAFTVAACGAAVVSMPWLRRRRWDAELGNLVSPLEPEATSDGRSSTGRDPRSACGEVDDAGVTSVSQRAEERDISRMPN